MTGKFWKKLWSRTIKTIYVKYGNNFHGNNFHKKIYQLFSMKIIFIENVIYVLFRYRNFSAGTL